MFGEKPGRHVHIFRFGGQGNDWCFVRTPDDYDPQGKPSPFILCNHGNGWVMDGSEQKANFTGKTQFGVDRQHHGAYVDRQRPGYREYSSPTIEAFLSAGYIVCGAQNDADLLYGNARSVRACSDFYRHMIGHYHTDADNGFMLGCSNGFMTALNASVRLGQRAIKALIGLYPLCNLRHAFEVTHTEGVKRAYGIESAFEYRLRVGDYDPFLDPNPNPDVPPVLLLWSASDGVLPMNEHAVRYAEYLKQRGRIVESVRVDRDGEDCQHGDWRHFRHDEIVGWCEKHRTRRQRRINATRF